MSYRSAFYSRNCSYSRSANAENAECDNRFPRSRAAKFLGLNIKAFDAGVKACNYQVSEWHHVGKYATEVNYYDTEELANQKEFWEGASASYKTKKKQNEVMFLFQERIEQQRRDKIKKFKQKLINKRDCSKLIKRHNSAYKWDQRCIKAGINWNIPIGDILAFRTAVATKQVEEEKINEFHKMLDENFSREKDSMGREIFVKGNTTILIHNGGINIGPDNGTCLKIGQATLIIKEIFQHQTV